MTAKCFADTNIVLYTIGQDSRKAGIARGIVAARPLVSAQVINEKPSMSACANLVLTARRLTPSRTA